MKKTIKILIAVFCIITASLFWPVDISRINQESPYLNDRNGELLHIDRTKFDTWQLNTQELDSQLTKLLIDFEDRYFYIHPGVNPLALLRATYQAIKNKKIISGGSTITMQLARLLKPGKRTFARKFYEIWTAFRLTAQYSKADVLKMYFSLAPYGGNINGVRAASLYYFGKEVSRLPINYKALLVALPQSPSLIRPDKFKAKAITAKNKVLSRCRIDQLVSQQMIDEALSETFQIKVHNFVKSAPHAFEYSKTKPLKHLDKTLQISVSLAMNDYVEKLPQFMNAACIVYNYRTCETLVYIGSVSTQQRFVWNNMCQAIRSPGSLLKPFIFGLAMHTGALNPNTWINDQPINIKGYSPENFDMNFLGEMRIEEALQQSLNTPVVQVLNKIGPGYFFDWLKTQPIKLFMPKTVMKKPDLAIGLGGLGICLNDLVLLYARLASGKLLKAEANQWLHNTLRTSVMPDNRQNNPGIAFKTGTSYGFRDAWAIGYDENNVVGIWVGRADGTPCVGFSGRIAAVPLMLKVFEQLGIHPLKITLDTESIDSNFHFEEQQNFDFKITMPKEKSTVLAEHGKPIFFTTNRNNLVKWYVNGKYIGESTQVMQWQPKSCGFYKITAENKDTETVSNTIEVVFNSE